MPGCSQGDQGRVPSTRLTILKNHTGMVALPIPTVAADASLLIIPTGLCFYARPHLFPLPQERTTRRTVSGRRKSVRQIQSRELSEIRRTILLLLGEKAGMREVVNHLKSECRRGNLSLRNWMTADGSHGPPCEIRRRQWEALVQGIISQGEAHDAGR